MQMRSQGVTEADPEFAQMSAILRAMRAQNMSGQQQQQQHSGQQRVPQNGVPQVNGKFLAGSRLIIPTYGDTDLESYDRTTGTASHEPNFSLNAAIDTTRKRVRYTSKATNPGFGECPLESSDVKCRRQCGEDYPNITVVHTGSIGHFAQSGYGI